MMTLSTLTRIQRIGAARKRGVTLIEAVLYISIALALIVGGLVFFQQASLAQRTNNAVRNISAIASETRGLYQQSNSFANFTEQALISAGAVPTGLQVVDPTTNVISLSNEWGGDVTAAASTLATNGNTVADGFTVTYERVPQAACVRLTTADVSGSGRVGSGIRSVAYAPTGAAFAAATTYRAANGNTALLAPQLVADYCRTAGTATGANGIVDLQFTFNR